MSTSPNASVRRKYGGIDAEERRRERRASLLRAGLELIGEHGYRAITLRMLCSAAGLNDRYFYESFENMEGMLCALYMQEADRLHADLLNTVANSNGDIHLRIKRALEVYFSLMRDPNVARLILVDVLGVSAGVDDMHNANSRRSGMLLVSLFHSEFQERLPAEQEKAIAIGLTGACAMMAQHWLLDRYQTPQEDLVSACVTLFTGTLNEMLKKAKPPSSGSPHVSAKRTSKSRAITASAPRSKKA